MTNENHYGRKRPRVHLTLSEESAEYLKTMTDNASKLVDALIRALIDGIEPSLVLISQKEWACPDSNRRSSPCKGDVMTS